MKQGVIRLILANHQVGVSVVALVAVNVMNLNANW